MTSDRLGRLGVSQVSQLGGDSGGELGQRQDLRRAS